MSYPSGCLDKQPAEMLNRICSFLFNPNDLLSLALTAKTLYNVIVPKHLDFRIIRCDIRRRNVWNKVASVPALTSQFVALEIIPEDPTSGRFTDIVLPISYLGKSEIDQDDPSEWPRHFRWGANQASGIEFEISCAVALAKAIGHMSTLRCFHWADYSSICSPDIFLALKHSCPRLTDVEVMIDGDFLESAHQDFASCPVRHVSQNLGFGFGSDVETQLWQFKDLTRFSLTFMHVSLDEAVAREYVERMTEMLIDRCPDLEELLLRLGSQEAPNDITSLVTTARWPRLKRLSLAAKVHDDEEVLANFLAKHPQLQELQLCQGITASPIVRLSNLPNLRSLHLGWGVACRDIAPEVTQNLEYLGLFLDSGADEKLGRLLTNMPKLRQFELVGVSEPLSLHSLTSMVKACPCLERLAIHGAHLEVEEEAFDVSLSLRRLSLRGTH